jgi:hypothetical protein
MTEVPPGGTNTFVLSTFSSVEEADTIDRLVITGAAAGRSYVTKYYTNSSPLDTIFLGDDKQSDFSGADSSAPAHPATLQTVMSCYAEGGRLYLVRNGTTSALNQMYCLPMKAHRQWADETGVYIITPKLVTTGAIKFYRVYLNIDKQRGDSTFGAPTEDYDLLYRTTGITNNTGDWSSVTNDGDLTNISSSDEIQFKIRFKVLGTWCIPPRIYGLVVVYEDSNTDSHYTPSIDKSNVTSRIFAYRQTLAWGSNIPNLRIRIYNAATSSNVLDDTVSGSAYGTWEYSTNGTVWNSWSASADNVGNYIRYTATTLPDSIVASALLTQ